MSNTYKDYLNADYDTISALSDKELRKIVGQMRDVAHKRIKRLQETRLDLISPAVDTVRVGGKVKPFSTKNIKTRLQLENTFLKARNFIKAKTSTVTGAKRYRDYFIDNVFEEAGKNLTTDQMSEVFKAYGKFRDNYGDYVSQLGSSVIQKYMVERAKGGLTNEEIYELSIKYFNERLAET